VALPIPNQQTIPVSLADIGKIMPLPDGYYLLEIMRADLPLPTKVIVLISMKGEIKMYVPKQKTEWGFAFDLEAHNLPAPRKLFEVGEFMNIPTISMREAFARAREVAEQTIVFDDDRIYDLVVAWAAYTWIRGLFPKNINLYITGFPGTGKSQVLNFLKRFARYPTDYDPGSDRSYKWHVAQTLGTLMIDEGEYLTRSSVARLRKYHEAGVIESRMMGLPMIGLTQIDLRVDAPIAVAATHLPRDTAFLQRGFIIRMKKRKPRIKDFNMIPGIEETTKQFAKSFMVNWFTVFLAMQQVHEKLTAMDLDERVKDLVLPIATILEVVERPWEWVVEYAQRSFSEANFVTPETMAFILALDRFRQSAKVVGDHYVAPLTELYIIIDEVAEELQANPAQLRYLLQYVFAGCSVARCINTLCFVCDKKTVDHVVEQSLPCIDVEFDVGRGSTDAIEARSSKKGRAHIARNGRKRLEVVIGDVRVSFND